MRRGRAGEALPAAPVQRIADAALAADPGRVLQYIAWDKDEPGVVTAFTNSAPDGKPDDATVRAFDAVRATLLGTVGTGPMLVVLKSCTPTCLRARPANCFSVRSGSSSSR
jgi:hypothetical protein